MAIEDEPNLAMKVVERQCPRRRLAASRAPFQHRTHGQTRLEFSLVSAGNIKQMGLEAGRRLTEAARVACPSCRAGDGACPVFF